MDISLSSVFKTSNSSTQVGNKIITSNNVKEIIGASYDKSLSVAENISVFARKNSNANIAVQGMHFDDLVTGKYVEMPSNVKLEKCSHSDGIIGFYDGDLSTRGKDAVSISLGKNAKSIALEPGSRVEANGPGAVALAKGPGTRADANAPKARSYACEEDTIANANAPESEAHGLQFCANAYANFRTSKAFGFGATATVHGAEAYGDHAKQFQFSTNIDKAYAEMRLMRVQLGELTPTQEESKDIRYQSIEHFNLQNR